MQHTPKNVQKQFAERAKDYNSYTSWMSSRSLFEAVVFPLQDLIPDAYCLDIGGGTGYVATEDIKTSQRRWVICDLSSEMGRRVTKSTSVRFIQGNGHDLPFKDAVFDFILIRSVLYYVDIERVLEEAYRVLKVNGYLVIAEKIFNKKHLLLDDFKRLVKLRNALKINVPTTEDIKTSLANTKFEFITLQRLEEAYTQDLDIYLSRSNTAPIENRDEVLNILRKFADANAGIRLNEDNTFTFQINWEIFYSRKAHHVPNQAPIVVSMIVERCIRGQNHILVQKRKSILKEPDYYDYWELPQGKVEGGENIQTAIRRELSEETGLKLEGFRSKYNETRAGDNYIETIETNNCVAICGRLNFISLCVIISASGTPCSPTIASEPQWISLPDLRILLRNEKVFPLNIPMLKRYLSDNA